MRTRLKLTLLAILSTPFTVSADPLAEVQRHINRTRSFRQAQGIEIPGSDRSPDSFPALDADYEALTAQEKLVELFDVRIGQTAYPEGDYPSLLWGLFPTAKALIPRILEKTLTRVSDEFEKARLKSIHTFGSVAKVEFVPTEGSPYTGLFRGAVGVARFSYAGPDIPLLIGNVPGLGIKLLVDGRPSENLVVMNGLNTQGKETSVFKKTFSNHLPPPSGPIMNAIRIAFEAVVGKGNGFNQPVDNLARVDRFGQAVEDPRWPYRIAFVPVDAYPFPADSREDFRVDLDSIPENFTLYKVYGWETEASINADEMGTLVTRSRFIASSFGDKKLFFKHNATFLER